MTITLTQELELLVAQQVQTGRFRSAQEVVREGLRLLQEQEEIRRIRQAELRHDVMQGVADIRAGRYKQYATSQELADNIIAEAKTELHNRHKPA